MNTPARRIWIFQPSMRQPIIEIVVLGEPNDIAQFVTDLRCQLETSSGFETVRPLGMGTQQLGFRVTRSNTAQHADPIAEAMQLLLTMRRYPIDWCPTAGAGMVGTW